MTLLRVGETVTRSHPLPSGAAHRIVSFVNPHVVLGAISQDGMASFRGVAPGHASYVCEFQTKDGGFVSAQGEQFRVLPAPSPAETPAASSAGSVPAGGKPAPRKGKKR